jgi:hypothetical protein
LEAGQTFIVACAVLLLNAWELSKPNAPASVRDGHLFSAYLMMPLAATTMGLLTFNWYPSQVGGLACCCWRRVWRVYELPATAFKILVLKIIN